MCALTGSRRSEQHNRSDVSQNLLRHRTGPNPLLNRSHCQAKSIRLLQKPTWSSPVAPAADPSAAGSEPIIMTHDKLGFDLVHRVHGHPDHDQERGTTEIKIYAQAV